MNALDVAGVSRRFGTRTVLDGIDLSIEVAGSVALLGASGSGKSTLLRIVAGLDGPDAGTITIAGSPAAGVPPHRRGVGLLFQDAVLFPHLDVAANVAFGLRMQRFDRSTRATRVAEVLALVGLTGLADRSVARLSGGEAQRVALARALAPRPELLLLDEPFGALDRTRRDDLVIELGELFDELGVAVLAVTHDPAEAAMLARSIAVLVEGRIAQHGPAAGVLTRPATAAVARLLGHQNVVSASAFDGGLRTPWCDVRGTWPTDTTFVLVPPVAFVPDPDGPIEASPAGVVWRDGTARHRHHVVGAPDFESTSAAARFRLDPADIHPMPG